MIELAIPDGPEAMTPAWLTTALQASGALTDAVVTAVTWQPLRAQGWTTQIARLAITYDAPEAGLPATLVTKSAAQDASTRAFFGRFYAREVAFYQRVAPEVPLRVPRCYCAAYEAATHAHVLLLEDIAPVLADDLRRGRGVYMQHCRLACALVGARPALEPDAKLSGTWEAVCGRLCGVSGAWLGGHAPISDANNYSPRHSAATKPPSVVGRPVCGSAYPDALGCAGS